MINTWNPVARRFITVAAVATSLIICGANVSVALPVAAQDAVARQACPAPGLWSVSARACVSKSWQPPGGVRVKWSSKTALRVKWTPVSGADGYRVYRWDAKKHRYRAAVTIKGGKVASWKDANLKKRHVYKYRVRWFRSIEGRRVWSPLSDWVSAITHGSVGRRINATGVEMEPVASLGLRGVDDLVAKVLPGKDLWGPVPVSRQVRFRLVSGQGVVRVSTKGRVVAVSSGVAVIEAVAHNGVSAKMRLTVADYTRPTAFDLSSVYAVYPHQKLFLTQFKDLVGQLTWWLSEHNIKSNDWFRLDQDGRILGPVGQLDAQALAMVTKLLLEYPYDIEIGPDGRAVWYNTGWYTDKHHHSTGFRYSPTLYYPADEQYKPLEIAPHWWVFDAPRVE